jgi:hypothetical protein
MMHPLSRLAKGGLMAVAMQQLSPVAHLPLVLGGIRKLSVAALIDTSYGQNNHVASRS